MNGVTGRMGAQQHLLRSILAIRDEGGLSVKSGKKIMVEPVLVGRDSTKLLSLAEQYGVRRWSTDLKEVLRDLGLPIFLMQPQPICVQILSNKR